MSNSTRRDRPALLVRVLLEIGKGRIEERWIADKDSFVHGECDGKTVTVNAAVDVVDTLLHEALHRLEPEWGEAYIRNRTTYLMRRMTDEQLQTLHAEYQKLVVKRKPKREE